MRVHLFIALAFVSCGRVGFEQSHGDTDNWSHLPAEPPANDPSALVQVSNLRSPWATTHWTFWFWTNVGVAGDLETLEFTIAESMVEAVNRVGSADTTVFQGTIWPADLDLAALGGLLAGERTPDTGYVAILTATDTSGHQSIAVAPTRTLPEPDEALVIFHDDDTAGHSIPDDFVRSTDTPFGGSSHHYQWTVSCPEPPCFQILRRQELAIDLTVLDATNFDRAFVEFAAASTSVHASSESMVRLWFGTTAVHDGTTLFGFGSWPMFADGSYEVYQFPLSALANTTDTDAHLTLDIARQGLFEFGVAGEWSAGSVTRLDEWRIRW